jgi:hypothetical protein
MVDERVRITDEPDSRPMFEVITEQEARKRLRTVQLDATIEQYRQRLEAGLDAVQQGQRFHVRPPSGTALEERALKGAIKRLAKNLPFQMEVRFDRAQEGFLVRLATDQEKQLGMARGRMLTAARDARAKEQLKVAQAIMAQPVSPEGVETGENPFAEPALSAPSDRRSRRAQPARAPGAGKGEPAAPSSARRRR